MCLIVVGWHVHPDYPLVVAANRDEFHARPTAAAARWADAPQVGAGRDLEAGGTWLGIAPGGRFAAVTNVREPGQPPGQYSRGALTADFLRSTVRAADYAAGIDGQAYAGFNLLLGDGQALWYLSNRDGPPRALPPGIYGLSNRSLDTPWPKLVQARTAFAEALRSLPDEAACFALLADRSTVDDADLPSTGVPLAWERLLSAIFVCSERYGTRASTLVLQETTGHSTLIERSFDASGKETQSSRISTGV